MKKVVSIVLSCLFSLSVLAQEEDVTRFLGIPVDGTKSEMIRKLEAKGYRYNASSDILEGEFNGAEVYISVVTNNNKVYRIVVWDAIPVDVRNIQIRFNRLCQQFGNNSKYTPYLKDQIIPDDEDIAYEMTVNNKRYQACFFQNPIGSDSSTVAKYLTDNATDEEKFSVAFEYMMKKTVWFTIYESPGEYGKYGIVMFYDNKYNEASGEDL